MLALKPAISSMVSLKSLSPRPLLPLPSTMMTRAHLARVWLRAVWWPFRSLDTPWAITDVNACYLNNNCLNPWTHSSFITFTTFDLA